LPRVAPAPAVSVRPVSPLLATALGLSARRLKSAPAPDVSPEPISHPCSTALGLSARRLKSDPGRRLELRTSLNRVARRLKSAPSRVCLLRLADRILRNYRMTPVISRFLGATGTTAKERL